jgi:hypothetical protein
MLFPQKSSAFQVTDSRRFAAAIMIGYQHAINQAIEIPVQLQGIQRRFPAGGVGAG